LAKEKINQRELGYYITRILSNEKARQTRGRLPGSGEESQVSGNVGSRTPKNSRRCREGKEEIKSTKNQTSQKRHSAEEKEKGEDCSLEGEKLLLGDKNYLPSRGKNRREKKG